MKNTFTLILSITILILTVIFTLQNAQVTEVKLLFWNTEASLSLILFITLAIGIISAIINLLPAIFSLRTTNNKLKNEITALKQQNNATNYNNEILKKAHENKTII